MLVVEPADGVLVGLDSNGNTVVAGAGLALRFICIAVKSVLPNLLWLDFNTHLCHLTYLCNV
jgi:hypothetical protein